MVFGFNKNKREVMDLRNRDNGGIPSDGYLKRKGNNITGAGSSIVSPSITTAADFASTSSDNTSNSSSNSSSNSGGGFFSFFGNNDSNNSASSSSSSNSTGSSYGGYGNSSSSSTDVSKVEERLNDLLYRFSRVMDRVELLEKKMDRLDRRNNNE